MSEAACHFFLCKTSIFYALLVIVSPLIVVLETLIVWGWTELFTYLSWWIITRILCFFETFLTQFVKNPPFSPCLSSKVFLFSVLFDHSWCTHCSVFFDNLAISLTEWPERTVTIDAWVLTQTVLAFTFMKEQKIWKKTAINTKIENLQTGSTNMAGKNTRTYIFAYLVQKVKKRCCFKF